MPRKMKHDDNGVSPITTAIAIILIGIVFWQFALPYIDDSIPTFLETIQPIPDDVYGIVKFKDLITNEIHIPTSSTEIALSDGHVYSLIIETNAPYLIGDGYKFVYRVRQFDSLTSPTWQIVAQAETYKIPFNAIWTDTFSFNTNITYGYDWIVDVSLYTPTGNIIGLNYLAPAYLTEFRCIGT